MTETIVFASSRTFLLQPPSIAVANTRLFVPDKRNAYGSLAPLSIPASVPTVTPARP